MNADIPLLKCPSCATVNPPSKAGLSFGTEVKCGACGSLSTLVFNRVLYVLSAGEHVCISCGRVAKTGVRFCQCSACMVGECQVCEHEFSSGQSICPRCGWSRDVDPSSPSGIKTFLQRIDPGLRSKDDRKRQKALDQLSQYVFKHLREVEKVRLRPLVDVVRFIIQGILEKNDMVFFSDYLAVETDISDGGAIWTCMQTLGEEGAPLILLFKGRGFYDGNHSCLSSKRLDYLSLIGPPVIPLLKEIITKHGDVSFEMRTAIQRIGTPARVALNEITGFFSSRKLKDFVYRVDNYSPTIKLED